MGYRTIIGIGLLAGTVLGGAAPALAQAAAPAASRDARIDALEAQLQRIEAEIASLRAQGPAASPAPSTAATAGLPAIAAVGQTKSPTTANSADVGTGAPGAARSGPPAAATQTAAADKSSRVFGAGVPTTGAVARIDAGHPVIATSDGRFTASLLGVMQFDVADYFQRSAGAPGTDLRRGGAAGDTARARNLADGSVFRRARIGIGGKAFGDFDYSILFDFGGAGLEDSGHVQELWLQYSGWKPAHIRVGAFAPFIGLEDAGSTNGMPFLERPASADIARSLAGGDTREGAQVAFTGKRWFASAAITGRTVNAAGSGGVQPYQSQLGYVARGGVLPVKTADAIVHVGLHGSYVDHPANTGGPDATATTAISPIQLRERPELRVDGTRLIDTGAIDARHAFTAGAEAAAQWRNLMIQGEYEHYGIDRRSAAADPRFNGYYVEGTWLLTGERRRYNDGNYAFDGPQITRPFNPAAGDFGAIELALRWSEIDLNYRQGAPGTAPTLDSVRGGDQRILTGGLNWYLNSVARIMLDVQRVQIRRLSPSATAYATPVGAQVGQTYEVGSARFQLAF